MKKITLDNRIFLIYLLILIFSMLCPIIVYASFDCWPKTSNTMVLYWVSFVLFPMLSLFSGTSSLLKKKKEVTILYIELFLSIFLLVVPYFNLIFAMIQIKSKVLFVIPLIIDILIIIAYVSIKLLLKHANHKMVNTLTKNKSIKIDAVPLESFENEDGTFKGCLKGEK